MRENLLHSGCFVSPLSFFDNPGIVGFNKRFFITNLLKY